MAMIVLWVVLGILLGIPAVLLLLLSFPLTLKVKSETGEPTEIPVLNEDTIRQMEQMELSPEERQVLTQMLTQAGTVQKPGEKEITAAVKWLGLTFRLWPQKPKPEKSKKEKKPKEKSAQTKKEEKPKEKNKIDWKKLVPLIVKSLKQPLEKILRDICIKDLQIDGLIAEEDTAQSALTTQKYAVSGYALLAVMKNMLRVKRAQLNIHPDFSGNRETDWNFYFKITIHPVVFVAAGLQLVWKLFRGGILDIISPKETGHQQASSGVSATQAENQ